MLKEGLDWFRSSISYIVVPVSYNIDRKSIFDYNTAWGSDIGFRSIMSMDERIDDIHNQYYSSFNYNTNGSFNVNGLILVLNGKCINPSKGKLENNRIIHKGNGSNTHEVGDKVKIYSLDKNTYLGESTIISETNDKDIIYLSNSITGSDYVKVVNCVGGIVGYSQLATNYKQIFENDRYVPIIKIQQIS